MPILREYGLGNPADLFTGTRLPAPLFSENYPEFFAQNNPSQNRPSPWQAAVQEAFANVNTPDDLLDLVRLRMTYSNSVNAPPLPIDAARPPVLLIGGR